MTAPRGSAVRRTGQLLTGFGSLVVLIVVLVGAPVALLAFAGNPLPDQLPTLAEVGTTLTSRDDGQLFLRALAVVGWLGWASFAFSVLVELGAAAARRPAPRLPGLSRQQRAAAALVGSVALLLAAAPAASAASAVAYPAAGTAYPAVAAGAALAAPAGVGTPTTQHGVLPAGAERQGGAPDDAGLPAGRSTAPPVYRVAKGDYLGEVAERYLDDFDRYREVARLNRLSDPDRIHPGQLIRLPAQATDGGVREHATGRLVATPPRKPSPRPPADAPQAATPPAPAESATPQAPGSPGEPTREMAGGPVGTAGGQAAAEGAPAGQAAGGERAGAPQGPAAGQSPQVRQATQAPAMAVGASRTGDDDRLNRPLAVSAVLAVASIVGAQIGAVLGLRRRPAARVLDSGRHRRG
ncbi:LysM peptidoglycan-binding domain-containing protein [Micromonospora sp. KC723]|uniref:LysM peptidoglycan-binding domain-containing protein n=1 Tax=Micromonospora sp. KC723 TaxID=2530381 RepID=UPI0010465EA9|nr:LysM peptidoglycan-binding domain-containing protein [Micromonospora sp. KC723]TDB70609.1 LysM peptidoglycan-binding domain-containing protein [Micromonospora sp. KC723]